MPTAPHKGAKRPTVSIVGSGRLGTALAIALSRANYQIEAVVAHGAAHARRAAGVMPKPGTKALSRSQLARLPASQILFITTPDGEILNIATQIAELKASSKGRTVFHTSGALPASEVLAPLAAAGFATGSLHPLVSVSEARTGADKLRGE
jgi:predicted short-subunit dehydrogenase-like oxidoreductase (DUF2520 family)